MEHPQLITIFRNEAPIENRVIRVVHFLGNGAVSAIETDGEVFIRQFIPGSDFLLFKLKTDLGVIGILYGSFSDTLKL